MKTSDEVNPLTKRNESSNAFHLQLDREMDESVIRSMLKRAGIPVKTVRAVTPLHHGIAVTLLLAGEEWDQGTGAAGRNGQCRNGKQRHTPYHDLTQEQRDEFHRDLGQALDYHRANSYSLNDSELSEAFRDIAVTPCEG